MTSSSDSEVVDTTIPTPINRKDKTEQTSKLINNAWLLLIPGIAQTVNIISYRYPL